MAGNPYLDRLEAEKNGTQASVAGAANDNPYLGAMAAEHEGLTTSLRASISQAATTNPDEAAKYARMAVRLGSAPGLVKALPDDASRALLQREIDANTKGAPTLRRKYTDADFAMQAHDDSGVLASIEKGVGALARFTLGGGFIGSVKAAPDDLLATTTGVKRAIVDVVEPWARLLGGPENGLAQLSKYYGDVATGAQIRSKDAKAPYSTDGIVGGGLDSGVGSLLQNTKYLPLALFGGPAGAGAALAGMALETFGGSYNKASEKGVGLNTKLVYAASDAVIEWATERGPLGALVHNVKAGSPFMSTLLRNAWQENKGEQVATLLQDTNEWAVINPEKTLADYIKERPAAAAQTLIATIVGSGGNVALAQGLQKAADVFAPDVAAARMEGFLRLEEAMKLATESKLRERNPEAFRELLQKMADSNVEDGTPSTVFVDAEVLKQMDPAVLQEVLPSAAAQMQEAGPINGLVEIPLGELLANTPGSALEQSLLQNIRLTPQGETQAEAKAASEQAQEYLQQQADAIIAQASDRMAVQQSADNVKQIVFDQLAKTKRFRPDVNEPYAASAAAFFTVLGNDLGITPEEAYARYPLRVQAVNPAQPGELLNKEAPATQEDFTREALPSLLDKTDWAVLTAEDPGAAKATPEQNAQRMAELKADLDAMGIKYQDVVGKYGDVQRSFIATGITEEQAKELGAKYGQESVLTRRGLVYMDGRLVPATGVETFDAPPEDFYTEVPGTGAYFSVNLDFDALKQDRTGFEEWFGDSKVVDKKGKPLVVYHGTGADIEEFDTYYGPSWFTANASYASGYAERNTNSSVVYPVYLAISNPLDISNINLNGALDVAKLADATGFDFNVLAKMAEVFFGDFDTKPKMWSMTNSREFVRLAQGAGYDGIKAKEGRAGVTWGVFSPEQVKSALGNSGAFDPDNSSILAQSAREEGDTRFRDAAIKALAELKNIPTRSAVGIMRGDVKAPKFKTIFQISEWFTKRNQRGMEDMTDAATKRRMLDSLEADLLYSLTDTGSAVGWYDAKVKAALAIMAEVHPEIATDEAAKFGFITILAITSNQTKVNENFALADALYSSWKDKKVFPTDVGAVMDTRAKTEMSKSLAKMAELVQQHGPDVMRDFMTKRHTVREIEAFTGYTLSGEGQNSMVYGAAFLGPKIGAFFNNLYGNFDTVTMDRWFMRTINRTRGSMLDLPGSFGNMLATLEEQVAAGVDTFGTEPAALLADIAAYRALPEAQQSDILAVLKVTPTLREYAKARHAAYVKGRELGGKQRGYVDRTPENLLAKSLDLALHGDQQTPRGGSDRELMRELVFKLQHRLQSKGIDMVVADIQAALWYYEKDLFAKLKGETAQADLFGEAQEAEDYETAARRVLAARRSDQGRDVAGPAGRARPTGRAAAQQVPARQFAADPAAGVTGDLFAQGPIQGLNDALQAKIDGDYHAAVAEYGTLPDSQGGVVLNTDLARELSPEYRADRSRSADVHEAASAFVKRLYADRLAGPVRDGADPLVLFTGGGTGAGKSTGLNLPTIGPVASTADIIFDTNMNTFASADQKIQQALASGREVALVYVYRDPVEALVQGALPRAMRMGRTVPLSEHQRTHEGAARAIVQLQEKYADNPLVSIAVVDNSRGRGNAVVSTLADLPRLDTTGLKEKLNAALETERTAGRITETVYAGFAAAGRAVEGENPTTGARTGGQLEQGAQPTVGVHFSTGQRKTLDGRFWGSGLKGAERERLNQPGVDPRLRERVAVYIDTGNGIRPESGVGGYAHQVVLPKLYDATRDPLKLKGGGANAFESRVLDAGYAGYWVPDFTTEQGAAVILGPASRGIQATPIEAPGRPTGAPTRAQDLEWQVYATDATPEAARARADRMQASGKWGDYELQADGLAVKYRKKAAEAPALAQRSQEDEAAARAEGWRIIDAQLPSAEAAQRIVASRQKVDPRGGGGMWAGYDLRVVEDDVNGFWAVEARKKSALAQGPRGTFSPKQLSITLLETADLSTFVHELGHFYLEVMADVASQPNPPARVAQDMEKLLQWFGVTDLYEWNTFTLDQKRAHHERFAESFEQYLLEGKAPSLALRPVFARLTSWMKAVYRNLKDFMAGRNLRLSDDVRQVFDRMLASEDEIAQAQQQAGFEQVYKSAAEAGMTPEEWAAYQDAQRAGTDAAIAEFQARSIRDLKWAVGARGKELKRLQAESAEQRKAMRDEVLPEVRQQRVYAAQRWLKTGELPDGTKSVGAKLSTAALKEMYGNEPAAPWRYLATNLLDAQEGLHPDVVAEMFGYTSGDELVRDIIAAAPEDAAVEALTDQRMLETYGDMATQAGMEAAANEAVHNEARARAVATDLAMLEAANGRTEQVGKSRVNVVMKAAKEFAQALVGRRKVRDLKAQVFIAAEARAGKKVVEAQKAGDTALAAEGQRDRLLNHFAAGYTIKAKAEVDKLVDYLRKFDKESVRAKLPVEYLDQIDKLLERFDLRKGVSNTALDKRAALLDWVESQRELGIEPDIPPEVLAEANRTSYKELTVDEFRGVADTIKQIEHLARLKNRLLTAKDKKDFEAVRDLLAESINDNAGDRSVDTRTPNTVLGAALLGIKKFGAAHIKVSTLARVMDGLKDGGPVWEYIIRTANDAGNSEVVMREQATKALTALLAPVLKQGHLGGKGVHVAEIGRSMNREAILAVALNTGNEGNLQRLLGGEGWAPHQVDAILARMTAADWAFVQSVWDYFETYKPLIGEKERRVSGREPNWVEAAPREVTSADGKTVQLRGGYYPIKYDPRASDKAEQHADAEAAKQQMRGAYTSATTRRSFTKDRAVEVNGRPLLYSLDGIYNGVQEVIHDLSWHEWLIDANRLLRDKKISAAMRERYGPESHQQFKAWVKDVAAGEQPAQHAGESALGWMRQGVSIGGLGFNVMSAVTQPLGLTQSIVRIGAQHVGKGLAKFLANPLSLTDEIHGKSEFMRTRNMTRLRELAEVRAQVKGQGKVRRAIDGGAYYLMLRGQQLVDVPTWWGAYEKAFAEGNGEERAVALADQAVIDAQGSGTIKDQSAIERGGQALKLFTTFYSFFNTALNVGVAQTMGANTPAKKAKLAADYLLLYTVPAVLGFALKNALTPGDSGDDDKLFRKLISEQLSYLTGLMFGVRELGFLKATVEGSNFGTDYSGPSGLKMLSDVARLTKQTAQGELDDGFRKALISVAGDLLRLPSAQINRSITGAQALSDGKTDNPLAIITGYQEPKP